MPMEGRVKFHGPRDIAAASQQKLGHALICDLRASAHLDDGGWDVWSHFMYFPLAQSGAFVSQHTPRWRSPPWIAAAVRLIHGNEDKSTKVIAELSSCS